MIARRTSLPCSFVTLVLLLSGCNLSPDYVRPPSPLASTWSAQPQARFDPTSNIVTVQEQVPQPTASDVSLVTDIGWKVFFQDPRLQALIEIALTNNLDLRLAVQRVEQTRSQYGIAQSALWPQVQATVQGVRQGIPNDFRAPTAQSSVTNQYQATFNLTSFQIDLFGRLRNLSEAAYENYLSSAEAARNVQITLVAALAQQYYRVRLAELLDSLVKQTLSSREASYELVRMRFVAGVASELDLNQARVLLDSAAADRAKYARDLAQANNALELLLGQTLPKDLPAGASLVTSSLLKEISAGQPLDLLTNRPDILAAEHTLRGYNANIGAARAAFFPTINLLAYFGYGSAAAGSVFLPEATAWNINPQMTIPIFNGAALSASLDLAQANQLAALTQYQKTIRIAFQEVSDALAGEATYQAELEALAAQQQSAARTLELSNLRYTNGIDSYLQVQSAQINYYSTAQLALNTTFSAMVNRVRLFSALGGGLKP